MNKYLIAATVLLLIFFEGSAQSGLAALSRKFEIYQATWPKTRLHLIFNQDKYAPGDTAWFKAYFLTEGLTGIEGRQLLEINFFDSKAASHLRFMFAVNDGLGQNQLAIPATLPAGMYLVTAHSSWMKNFEPLQVFKKKIMIVQRNTVVEEEKPTRYAVPEGGHLVRDIPNKISIVTHMPGSPVQIIDSAGQEVLGIHADNNGVASGIFTPRHNALYFVQIAGGPERTPLPPTEDDGYGVLLTPSKTGEPLKIIVNTPPASSLRDEELIIVVSSRGKIWHTATALQGKKEFVELQIPQKNLPQGIAQLSILDQGGQLRASRLFYIQGVDQVQAKIQSTKEYFQAREKVRLEIFLADDRGQPVEGEFTISVLNAALFDDKKKNSLEDGLNFSSGISENIEVDRTDPDWLISLDNYLIAVPGDVHWQKIISGENTKPRFGFTSVVQKNGRVYNADTHEPVPDFTQVMFYLQKSRWSYQTFTLEKGTVRVTVPDLPGQDELFYLAETKKKKEIPNLKIEWEEDGPIPLPRAVEFRETEMSDPYGSFAAKNRLIDRSFGFYVAPEETGDQYRNLAAETRSTNKMTDADILVNIQDYILFPNMEELIREIIPSLFHRKSGGKSMIRVNLTQPMPIANGDPVYIIDGIATRNTAFFLSLKPAELLTVKIVKDPKKLLPRGLFGKNGIVIVETIKGNVREPVDDPSRLIEGLSRPVNFDVPDYSIVSDPHRPDFRSTIHWDPVVKTDANGKALVEFFCSDDVGKLSIRVDGLAKGGRPFSAVHSIEVVAGAEKK